MGGWWVGQPNTDPISGPSFDFTFTIGPELDIGGRETCPTFMLLKYSIERELFALFGYQRKQTLFI